MIRALILKRLVMRQIQRLRRPDAMPLSEAKRGTKFDVVYLIVSSEEATLEAVTLVAK